MAWQSPKRKKMLICLAVRKKVTTFAHSYCMVLNYIWIAFFLVAFVIALAKLLFMGDLEVFPAMMDATFAQSKTAFEISLGLTGVLSLWLGVMKIG